MIHRQAGTCDFLLRGVLIALIVLGVFGLVNLRSSVIAKEYIIGDLQEKKSQAMKMAKAYNAEMASMMSMQNIYERGLDLELPDRSKLVYVKRNAGGGVTFATAYKSAEGIR